MQKEEFKRSQNNRQVWPWSTKWSRAQANRVLSREHNGHSKHPFPTTQEMTLHMDITRWSILKSEWLCSLQPRMGSSTQPVKIRPGADCGSDNELLIAKFRLKLKKVGKTTRQFRCDRNQIPYNYTVEVMNKFKWLNLIECLQNYRWKFTTLYRRQRLKPSQRKKKCHEGKVIWGGFTNSWAKRIIRQWRKGKIYPTECRIPKNSKERQKGLFKWTMLRNRGEQQNG